jgi:hypothetical protein
VIAGAGFTVRATRLEVAEGEQVPVTTQSNPVAAVAASADAVLVI